MLLVLGALEARIPGTAKLLSARCLLPVLRTLDSIHSAYGQVCTSLEPAAFSIRRGWGDGFIKWFGLQAAAPALAYSKAGWPFYFGRGPGLVSIGDTYVAAVLSVVALL